MKAPESLRSLVEEGLIAEVIRPLRSGKEAQVYLVQSGGEERVAKVYKESDQRTFKHRSQYTEGRTSRNTRDQRALKRQSKYGKTQDEAAWRSAEADIIYRLRAAEVRVPEPFAFSDNVLIMALIRDDQGRPAPRLADIQPTPAQAQLIFEQLLSETVKMLCAGVVHGDLSEFNVLMGAGGPVIIDFPQALDPAKNGNARRILLRDVGNLDRFLARHHRSRRTTRFGEEMWGHFEKQSLAPDMKLTGTAPKPKSKQFEGDSLLAEIQEMERASRERREALGLPPPRPARAPVFRTEVPAQKKENGAGRRGDNAARSRGGGATRPAVDGATRPPGRRRSRGGGGASPARTGAPRDSAPSKPAPAPAGARAAAPAGAASEGQPAAAKRRRRRGRRRGAGPASSSKPG